MNQKVILIIVLVAGAALAMIAANFLQPTASYTSPQDQDEVPVTPIDISESDVVPQTNIDVFSATRSQGYSNVVGYIGRGAFVMTLPDWIPAHWRTIPTQDTNTLRFTPQESLPRDHSDIVITLGTTTEIHNALTLFERDKKTAYTSEVLLSDEGEERIYYIETRDQGKVFNTFYMDGNGKTAQFIFYSSEASYSSYAPKIREFVRGFGKGSVPRG